jgi:hypothetical protein
VFIGQSNALEKGLVSLKQSYFCRVGERLAVGLMKWTLQDVE